MKARGTREEMSSKRSFEARRDDIAKVLARLGIEAKRAGDQWVALCPNPDHEDRHPSWRIRDRPGTDRHGKHWCHACGWGGSIVFLVMELRECSAHDASEWLRGHEAEAKPPTAVDVELRGKRKPGILPEGVTLAPLEEWIPSARAYAQARGIEAWQGDRWGLGYAADGPLGGRIVFPYRRPKQRDVVGYSARTFVDDPKRYLEAVGGPGRDAVFGEERWTFSREKGNRVYVVEGVINALAVERAMWPEDEWGEEPVCVASLAGSNPGAGRIAKIARFGEVVLLTDPDATGDRVARELSGSLARHCRLIRVRLPEGSDAADLPEEELRCRLRRT